MLSTGTDGRRAMTSRCRQKFRMQLHAAARLHFPQLLRWSSLLNAACSQYEYGLLMAPMKEEGSIVHKPIWKHVSCLDRIVDEEATAAAE